MDLEKIKKIVIRKSKELNLSVQLLWDTFFFERFLLRLSISNFKNLFLFKGGFLLQSIVGINNRSTLDIDLKIIAKKISDAKLLEIFNEICSKKIDEIKYQAIRINSIGAETKYGGKTIKINAEFYNIKKIFNIDIGTGDVVTPGPVNYTYRSILFGDEFKIISYPIETIIAEKFETLISKGINNSRSKDLFDLYLLMNKESNIRLVNSAIINTFYLRGTKYDFKYIKSTIEQIFNSETVKTLFDRYASKKTFVNGKTFEDCRNSVCLLFNQLKFCNKINLSDYDIELHIVRHGKDDQNKLGGWSSNHLTEEGKKEIEYLLNDIDDEYDLFISSDLNRAKETSSIINKKLNMNILFDSNFREINNGILMDLTLSEFNEKYPNLSFSKLKMDEKYPGGESPDSFFKRISYSFTKLLEENRGKKILLITHGGVITIILCLLNGYDYNNNLKIEPKYGTILKFK